jgi:hypothetical protein
MLANVRASLRIVPLELSDADRAHPWDTIMGVAVARSPGLAQS